jgi:hypothetical protein
MLVFSNRPPNVKVCAPNGMVRFSVTSMMSCSSRLFGENCSVPNVTAAVGEGVVARRGTTATEISGACCGTMRSSRSLL